MGKFALKFEIYEFCQNMEAGIWKRVMDHETNDKKKINQMHFICEILQTQP